MDQPYREIEMLRERLSRLSAASLRINESLDFDTVLQGVLDSARSLTAARYGVMTLLDDAGGVQDFLSSGMTGEEAGQLWLTADRWRLFESLTGISEPVRVPDLVEHVRALGFTEFTIPLPVEVFRFMASPMFHRGARVGHVFVGDREDGEEFTREDEEILVMFAAQAALVIANARTHREERKARADLETLVNTSPVGVVVFDARTGEMASVNREAMRIVDTLREEDQTPENPLESVTCVRGDGREISLKDFTMAELLSVGETVRAEEIALLVPGGRNVRALLNATPIHGEDGELASFVITLQDLTPLEEQERLRAEFLVPRQLFLPNCRQLVLPVHLLSRSSLTALLCCISPVAGDVKLQDDGVVHDPVDGRGGGHGVGEDAFPPGEDQVGRDAQRPPLVAFGDQGEEDLGLFVALGQVAQVVQEQEVEVVQLAQLSGQVEVALGGQQVLHQAVGRCEEDGVARFHQAVAQGTERVGLAGAGETEGQHVDAVFHETALGQMVQLLTQCQGHPVVLEGLPGFARG